MRLKVDMYDEVYYPVVKVVHTNVTDEKPQEENVVVSDVAKTEVMMPTALTNVMKKTNEPKRKKRSLWRMRLGTCVAAVVAIIAITLVGLRLAGFRTFTVMSGSMEPQYPVGAMVYVKPVDYQSLKVGDVISFVADDDKTVVTHRIAEIEIDEKDASVWRFRTKGDANNTPDANLVHYKNVLGTPMITIPFIGRLAYNIQQPPGIYIALVVGTLLLAWTFLPGTLEERRKTARKSVA